MVLKCVTVTAILLTTILNLLNAQHNNLRVFKQQRRQCRRMNHTLTMWRKGEILEDYTDLMYHMTKSDVSPKLIQSPTTFEALSGFDDDEHFPAVNYTVMNASLTDVNMSDAQQALVKLANKHEFTYPARRKLGKISSPPFHGFFELKNRARNKWFRVGMSPCGKAGKLICLAYISVFIDDNKHTNFTVQQKESLLNHLRRNAISDFVTEYGIDVTDQDFKLKYRQKVKEFRNCTVELRRLKDGIQSYAVEPAVKTTPK